MKRLLWILVILLVSCTVYAQKHRISIEDKEFDAYFFNKKNIPVVKGKILNLTPEEIGSLKINYSVITPFEQTQIAIPKSCVLQPDGSFQLALEYAFPNQQIGITVGELFYGAVYAHTDLTLELDAKILKQSKQRTVHYGNGVKFSGKDAALNAYMAKHILFSKDKLFEISMVISSLRKEWDERNAEYPGYLKKYDSLYDVLRAVDKTYIEQNPSDFSGLIINQRLSAYYASLCVDYWGKEMPVSLFNKIKAHKVYLTSYDGMMFYNSLFFYLKTNVIDNTQPSVVEETRKLIRVLDSVFTSSKADMLKVKFSGKTPDDKKEVLEHVLAQTKTGWCREILQAEYVRNQEKLASINKALDEQQSIQSFGKSIAELPFGAKLYQADSMDSKVFLSAIKTRFPGKALLIDFWATWCGPCIAEFPSSKKLHDETRDLPVEFIYLCSSGGSTMEKWKAKISEFQLSGTHVYVDEKIINELMVLFSANGFPTYAWINKNGEYKPGVIDKVSNMDKDKLTKLLK